MDNKMPDELWIEYEYSDSGTYGRHIYDEPEIGRTKYIRADIHEAEITRLKSDLATMTGTADWLRGQC